MNRKIIVAYIYSLICFCFFLPTSVQAVEINGVNFANSFPAGQTRLALTGTAMLKWGLLFDVYAGAFYMPEGISGSQWTDNIPKRLELSYFRNFKAEEFSSTSDQLLRDNLSNQEYQALTERLQQFYQLFKDIKSGDRYSLTYHPETGTELRLNGELLGTAPGADFAVAYLGIWLGPQPINEEFRDRLLRDRS